MSEPADPVGAALVDQAIIDHAHHHGWAAKTLKKTRRAAEILLSLQDTPGASLKASEVLALRQIEMPARAVMDACDAAGLLEDDRTPATTTWFEARIADLP